MLVGVCYIRSLLHTVIGKCVCAWHSHEGASVLPTQPTLFPYFLITRMSNVH